MIEIVDAGGDEALAIIDRAQGNARQKMQRAAIGHALHLAIGHAPHRHGLAKAFLVEGANGGGGEDAVLVELFQGRRKIAAEPQRGLRIGRLEMAGGIGQEIEGQAGETAIGHEQAFDDSLHEIGDAAHAFLRLDARDHGIELHPQGREPLAQAPARLRLRRHEVQRVDGELQVGAQLDARAALGLVVEDRRHHRGIEGEARHEPHDQQEARRAMPADLHMLHGHVLERPRQQRGHRRHQRRHQSLARSDEGHQPIDEKGEGDEVERAVEIRRPGRRDEGGERGVQHPSRHLGPAEQQREELQNAEAHLRAVELAALDAARGLERRDAGGLAHEAPPHHERNSHANDDEDAEHQRVLNLRHERQRRQAAVIKQQRRKRAQHAARDPARQPARANGDQHDPADQPARRSPQAQQPQLAALVEHEEAREIGQQHARHEQQRQRHQQTDERDLLGDVIHAHEHGAEVMIHRRRGRAILHAIGDAAAGGDDAGEGALDVPARHEIGPVELRQMDDLGEIVAGIAVNVRMTLVMHETARHRVEFQDQRGIPRGHDDHAKFRHEGGRTRLLQIPAVELGGIDADHPLDARAQGEHAKGMLVLLVDLKIGILRLHHQLECLAVLQPEKGVAHLALGAHEHDDGFVAGGPDVRRNQAGIGGGEDREPGRTQLLPVDDRHHREGRDAAQEIEALGLGDAARLRHIVLDLARLRHIGGLIDRDIPGHALDLIVHIKLHGVTRGHIHRRQQEHHEKGHQAEGQEHPLADDAKQGRQNGPVHFDVNVAHGSGDLLNGAIAHVIDAGELLDHLGIMGGHEHGLAARGRQIDQHGGNDLGVVGVEIARGLIGEDDRGIVDKRQAHRHALLLATRQLLRSLEALGLQANGLQQAFGARPPLLRRHPGQQHGEFEILDGREAGDEIEELEHEANLAQAIKLELALGHGRDILAIDPDFAAARPVHAAQQIEDRGLAAA